MCGSQEHAVAGLAQSEHGDPAVDFFGFDPGVNLGRDKRQSEADECALDQVTTQRSWLGEEDYTDDEIDAYQAGECCQISGCCSVHIFLFYAFAVKYDSTLPAMILWAR